MESNKEYILNDGKAQVYIINSFITVKESEELFNETLNTTDWVSQEYNFSGKIVIPKRKMYAYGDDNVNTHSYSGQHLDIKPWNSSEVGKKWLNIRDRIHQELGIFTNAVLLNYYPDGNAGITPHNDKEVIKGKTHPISSPVVGLSLGAKRKFTFEPIVNDSYIISKFHIFIKNAQLMVMDGETQLRYKHGIPYEKMITEPRISGTFRLLNN